MTSPTINVNRGPNPDSRSNIQFVAVQGTEEQRKGHQEKKALVTHSEAAENPSHPVRLHKPVFR